MTSIVILTRLQLGDSPTFLARIRTAISVLTSRSLVSWWRTFSWRNVADWLARIFVISCFLFSTFQTHCTETSPNVLMPFWESEKTWRQHRLMLVFLHSLKLIQISYEDQRKFESCTCYPARKSNSLSRFGLRTKLVLVDSIQFSVLHFLTLLRIDISTSVLFSKYLCEAVHHYLSFNLPSRHFAICF